MNRQELVNQIRLKESFLCVGLDTDLEKLPHHFPRTLEAMLDFNKTIIDHTLKFSVSYKLNLAFYEAYGTEGWDVFQQTVNYLQDKDVLVIADAKRGDIGNTSQRYAKAFFEQSNCDALTINPYMGHDSISPFLGMKDKWVIALGLTSNPGAEDLELQKLESGKYVFEHMIQKMVQLGSEDDLMFVVGATQKEYLERIRDLAPNHFLLVPGVGAQGGAVADLNPLKTEDIGMLVNSSRQIIYASKGTDFGLAAAKQALDLQSEMAAFIKA